MWTSTSHDARGTRDNPYNSRVLPPSPALKTRRLFAVLAASLIAHRTAHGRDGLRSAEGLRPVLGGRLRKHLRALAHLRLPRAARAPRAAHRRDDPRAGRGRHALYLPHQAGHLLRRRPGLQGAQARARRERCRVLHQALPRSDAAQRLRVAVREQDRGPGRGGRARQEERQVRLRRASGRHGGARQVRDQLQAEGSRLQFPVLARDA